MDITGGHKLSQVKQTQKDKGYVFSSMQYLVLKLLKILSVICVSMSEWVYVYMCVQLT